MAEIFGVSARTVHRRLKEFDIGRVRSYSAMSDNELDEVIIENLRGNTRLGPNAVMARLRGRGIMVQRQRVRDSMLRTDPEGAAERAMRPQLYRRRYRVTGPNSLWHLDGNHKLIRWRVVIHGAIDGFSRLLIFLAASDNNRAETVLNAYVEAVSTYGLPSRVRCDFGGENNDVCSLMEVIRGGGRGSALRGTSTHNQRIERSWVDMWCGVTNLYYDLFSFLEAEGLLNVDDAVQIWALHYIYLPRINQDLKLFIGQWNNHGLRTEGSKTPLQLFVGHVLRLQGSNHTAIQDMFGVPLEHAERPPPEGMDFADLVEVPATALPLSIERHEQLMQLVDPLDTSDPFGISLYTRTLAFVQNL
ncbi:uncharacterized protein LOC129282611 [Lytechinus pictus]|uniref:uncharacterized protein LOC129282611 n=1 Tax=Lytechinus pictus TaxID=7653 RepID=UPI0030B9BBAF